LAVAADSESSPRMIQKLCLAGCLGASWQRARRQLLISASIRS
jgi:hypothetical protein